MISSKMLLSDPILQRSGFKAKPNGEVEIVKGWEPEPGTSLLDTMPVVGSGSDGDAWLGKGNDEDEPQSLDQGQPAQPAADKGWFGNLADTLGNTAQGAVQWAGQQASNADDWLNQHPEVQNITPTNEALAVAGGAVQGAQQSAASGGGVPEIIGGGLRGAAGTVGRQIQGADTDVTSAAHAVTGHTFEDTGLSKTPVIGGLLGDILKHPAEQAIWAVGMALAPEAAIPLRVAQSAAIGGGLALTQAAADQNASAGDIAVQTAMGAGAGALFEAGGQVLGKAIGPIRDAILGWVKAGHDSIAAGQEEAGQKLLQGADQAMTELGDVIQGVRTGKDRWATEYNVPQMAGASGAEVKPEDLDLARNTGRETMMPLSEIQRDPETFQHRQFGIDPKTGSAGRIPEETNWDWTKQGVFDIWQDTNGVNWLVNGHNRYAKAESTGHLGDTVPVNIYREADGVTPAAAKALGAINNIAVGTAEPYEVADFIRQMGMEEGTRLIQLNNVPLSGPSTAAKNAQSGIALSGLSEPLWRKYLAGDLFPSASDTVAQHYAELLGIGLPQMDEAQGAVIDLANEHHLSEGALKEAIEDARADNGLAAKQQTLFGETAADKEMTAARFELKAAMRKDLTSDRTLYGGKTANASKAERLADEGNVINVEGNRARAQTAAQNAQLFDAWRNGGSETARAINEAAAKIAAGAKLKDVLPDVLDTFHSEADAFRGGGGAEPAGLEGREPGPSPTSGEVAATGEAGAVQPVAGTDTGVNAGEFAGEPAGLEPARTASPSARTAVEAPQGELPASEPPVPAAPLGEQQPLEPNQTPAELAPATQSATAAPPAPQTPAGLPATAESPSQPTPSLEDLQTELAMAQENLAEPSKKMAYQMRRGKWTKNDPRRVKLQGLIDQYQAEVEALESQIQAHPEYVPEPELETASAAPQIPESGQADLLPSAADATQSPASPPAQPTMQMETPESAAEWDAMSGTPAAPQPSPQEARESAIATLSQMFNEAAPSTGFTPESFVDMVIGKDYKGVTIDRPGALEAMASWMAQNAGADINDPEVARTLTKGIRDAYHPYAIGAIAEHVANGGELSPSDEIAMHFASFRGDVVTTSAVMRGKADPQAAQDALQGMLDKRIAQRVLERNEANASGSERPTTTTSTTTTSPDLEVVARPPETTTSLGEQIVQQHDVRLSDEDMDLLGLVGAHLDPDILSSVENVGIEHAMQPVSATGTPSSTNGGTSKPTTSAAGRAGNAATAPGGTGTGKPPRGPSATASEPTPGPAGTPPGGATGGTPPPGTPGGSSPGTTPPSGGNPTPPASQNPIGRAFGYVRPVNLAGGIAASVGVYNADENDDEFHRIVKAAMAFPAGAAASHVLFGGAMRPTAIATRAEEAYIGGLLAPTTGVVKGVNDAAGIGGGGVIRLAQAIGHGRIKTAVPEALNHYIGEAQSLGRAWEAFVRELDPSLVNKNPEVLGPRAPFSSIYERPSLGQYSATLSGRVLSGLTEAARVIIESGVAKANTVGGAINPETEAQRALLLGQPHTWSGQMVKGMLDFVHDRVPFLGPVLAPFRTIPANVVEKSIDWMPGLGLVNLIGADATARERTLIAQGLGALTVTGLAMAFGTNVNGGGPTDAKERNAWLTQHNMPFSFKNPVTGMWTSMQKLPPAVKGPMMAYGTFIDAQKYGMDADKAAATLGNALDSLDFFPQLFRTIGDAAAGKGQGAWKYFAASEAGGLLPWEVRQPAHGERDAAPDVSSRYVPDIAAAAGRGLQAAVPGLERQVPAAINNLGQPKPNTNPGIGAVVNPFRSSLPESDPVIQGLADRGLAVQGPPAKIANTPITPEEQRRFTELAGPQLLARATAMLRDPAFNRLAPNLQVERLRTLEADIRKDAAMKIVADAGPSFGMRMQQEPNFQARPMKYLGVNDRGRELQIDNAIGHYGSWMRNGRKGTAPTPQEMQLANAYMARRNPAYGQWQAKQAQAKRTVPA